MNAPNNQSQINNLEKNKEEIGNCFDDFYILKIIKESKYGFVAKVYSKKNNKIYAMKKSNLEKVEAEKLGKYYKNQLIFLKKLKNENICQYYTDFCQDNCLYIIMEYMDNGNLLKLMDIMKKFKIPEEKLLKIFLKCLNALVYIHSKGIIHRNIKLDSFGIDNNFNPKMINFKKAAVSDLEISKNFAEDEHKRAEIVNHFTKIGEGFFKAPEIDKDKYDNKIDVYSMGITFCSLAYLTNNLPDNEHSTTYSKELYHIIKKMLNKNPQERPTSLEVFESLKILYTKKFSFNSGTLSCLKSLLSLPTTNQLLKFDRQNVDKDTIGYQTIQCLDNIKNSNNDKIYSILYDFTNYLLENSFKKFLVNNKELEPYFILSNILLIIEQEMSSNKIKYFKDGVYLSIPNKSEALETFMEFYKKRYNSLISENFFGIIKEKKICRNCELNTYSFDILPLISFNVETLVKKNKEKKNRLTLTDAFECLNKNFIVLHEDRNKIMCEKCIKCTKHFQLKQFYKLPKNLIIFFNRGEKCKFKNFVNFDEYFQLNGKYVETFNEYPNGVIYNLQSIICRIQEYDENKKNKRKERYICFTKTNNEN